MKHRIISLRNLLFTEEKRYSQILPNILVAMIVFAEKNRWEISLRNFFFFMLFLREIKNLLFSFFSQKREICFFFLYVDCMNTSFISLIYKVKAPV